MTTPYWIWSEREPSLFKKVCFFRKHVQLDAVPERCEVSVSADSIYRLHVNGQLVCRGPQKSDRYRRYYETVDIAPYLQPGHNVLAAMVCHFIDDEENSRIFETGPISVLCSLRGGFMLACGTLDIATDRSWLVLESDSVRFVSPYLSRYGTDMLDVRLREYPHAYIDPDYDDSAFQRATIVTDTRFEKDAGVTMWPLTPSNIPLLEETPIVPARISRTSLESADALLMEGRVTISSGAEQFIEIDMGTLTTAHVEMQFRYATDKPLDVRLSYAESYFRLDAQGQLYKGVRDDTKDAVFNGEVDTLELRNGFGQSAPLKFETVFFRTFRFLRIDIGLSTVPVEICGLKFAQVLYPLEVTASCQAPALDRRMWEISLNTLRLCMHSTYEDCPYYEQMQYTMDTALQMKYTYQVSTDDRLARNAIDAFSASRIPDGLVTCTAPAKFTQVIPGFSMYFIEMLCDHYAYFGDAAFVRKYLCVADSVLQYFAAKIDPETGLFPRSDYWEFVDWVSEWHHNFGVPISKEEAINTVYHEMYVYFLKKAAELSRMVGRTGIAEEYLAVAERVTQGVRTHCFDVARGLFTDTVGRPDTSAHAQLWAVLSGIAEGEEAVRLMEQVLHNASLYQCSYSMTFYLLRALEMTGLYRHRAQYLARWETMMDLNMSTWCEDPVTQRSDCHGWSSLPIYEFAAMTLGVKPAAPGYGALCIAPYTGDHMEAEGSVSTARGPVSVRWEKRDGEITLTAQVPEGLPTEIVLAGQRWSFDGGEMTVRAKEAEA